MVWYPKVKVLKPSQVTVEFFFWTNNVYNCRMTDTQVKQDYHNTTDYKTWNDRYFVIPHEKKYLQNIFHSNGLHY